MRRDQTVGGMWNSIIGGRGRRERGLTARPAASRSRRIFPYILDLMKIVKVRRVGNSNVVSLPRELEASGYVPGTSVLVEELSDGELRILPTEKVRERVRQIAAAQVSEHSEALEILAEHDADPDASK